MSGNFNKNSRNQVEIARVIAVIIASWMLTQVSNSSVVYHWIRG